MVEMLELAGILRNAGLVETSAVLFCLCIHAGAALERGPAVELAPNAAALEQWRKKTQTGENEFEAALLADPDTTYTSAGADWLLNFGTAKKLGPILIRLLKREPRPKHLPGWSNVLNDALARDSKGLMLEALLRSISQGEVLKTLNGVILQKNLLPMVMESLVTLTATDDAVAGLSDLIDEIIQATTCAVGPERDRLTASLVRLGTGIILVGRRGPQAEAVLEKIERAGRRLRAESKDPQTMERTWMLARPGGQRDEGPGRVKLSLEGARHLATAFRKAGGRIWDRRNPDLHGEESGIVGVRFEG